MADDASYEMVEPFDLDDATLPPYNPVAALARRVCDDPFFFAHALARWQGDVSDAVAAAWLGVSEADLARLRLCRTPRDDSEVNRIAEAFGVDAATLRRVMEAE